MLEPERVGSSVLDFDLTGAKCSEVPMGIQEIGSGIDFGQLAKGVSEASIITMRGDGRPAWRSEALDLFLTMIGEGKDVAPLLYPGAHQPL